MNPLKKLWQSIRRQKTIDTLSYRDELHFLKYMILFVLINRQNQEGKVYDIKDLQKVCQYLEGQNLDNSKRIWRRIMGRDFNYQK